MVSALTGNEIVSVEVPTSEGLQLGPSEYVTTRQIAALSSGQSAQTASQIGASAKLVQVAQRCGISNELTGSSLVTNPYFVCHQRMLFPNGADAIQLVYPNFKIVGSYPTIAGETKVPPTMYTAFDVTYSGGSGYAVGDVDTFAITTTTGIAAAKVIITGVASGVPTSVEIETGGLYNTQLATGVSPSSTTGSGTGATVTFRWKGVSVGLHIGIEPVFGTLGAVGSGAGTVIPVGKGSPKYDTSAQIDLFIPMSDFLTTDIIPIDIPVGGAIGIRTSFGYALGPTMGRASINQYTAPGAPTANYETFTWMPTFTDYSLSGTLPAATFFYWFGIQPALVLGIPKQNTPSIIAVADSRCAGVASGLNSIGNSNIQFDILDADGNASWFEKALSRLTAKCYWPWSNFAQPSDELFAWLGGAAGGTVLQGSQGRLRLISMAKPTAVYLGLNVNDFYLGGYSVAQVQSWEQELVTAIRGCGVKYVFTDTTDPLTNSSDSWATVANQSYVNSTTSANIIARNTALAAGTWTAGYDFFIDQRPNTESSINSGKWFVNGTAQYGTGDGIHGSPQLVTLKAATAAAVIAAKISL